MGCNLVYVANPDDSVYQFQIRWRPVIVGFVLQFVMGVIVLRWKPGYDAIKFASDEITKFIGYSNEGAASVFGDPFFLLHPLVFVVSYCEGNLLTEQFI